MIQSPINSMTSGAPAARASAPDERGSAPVAQDTPFAAVMAQHQNRSATPAAPAVPAQPAGRPAPRPAAQPANAAASPGRASAPPAGPARATPTSTAAAPARHRKSPTDAGSDMPAAATSTAAPTDNLVSLLTAVPPGAPAAPAAPAGADTPDPAALPAVVAAGRRAVAGTGAATGAAPGAVNETLATPPFALPTSANRNAGSAGERIEAPASPGGAVTGAPGVSPPAAGAPAADAAADAAALIAAAASAAPATAPAHPAPAVRAPGLTDAPRAPAASGAADSPTAVLAGAAPAPAPASTPVTAPIILSAPPGSPAWGQQIGHSVIWMVRANEHSATLTVTPPELGPIKVSIEMSQNQAHASFHSDQPEVRAALEAALPRLREMLHEAGVELGQTSVGGGSPQDRADRRSGEGPRLAPDARTTVPVLRDTAQTIPGRQRGRIDTFV